MKRYMVKVASGGGQEDFVCVKGTCYIVEKDDIGGSMLRIADENMEVAAFVPGSWSFVFDAAYEVVG